VTEHTLNTLVQVCGTDGVTYANECHLRVAACAQKTFIVVASNGACGECVYLVFTWAFYSYG
jgi:hypothetical protein